jgi:hypothetical protein
MPYSPSTLTVKDSILDNLVASIQAIAPPSYGTNMSGRTVRIWNGDPFDLPSYPAVLVLPIGERTHDQRLRLLSHELEVAVVACVKDQRWPDLLDRLLADLRVAMLADWTRGGKAVTTRIEETTYWDAEASKPVGAAQVMLRIIYRTVYDDPTTAA